MAPKRPVRRALNLKPGDVLFLDYGEEGEPWHERVILAALGGARYMVLTPDEDMYEEAWSGAAFNVMFKQAAALVGLGNWELTPYILRHTGPSHDWLTKARGLEAIKRQGRWVSDLSVRRYEKGSRAMHRLASLDRGHQLLLAEGDRQLEGVLTDGRTVNFVRVLRDVGRG